MEYVGEVVLIGSERILIGSEVVVIRSGRGEIPFGGGHNYVPDVILPRSEGYLIWFRGVFNTVRRGISSRPEPYLMTFVT